MVGTNDPFINRYNLPSVPTPLLEDDIANKAYVDALSRVLDMSAGLSLTANNVQFLPINNGGQNSTTEALAQCLISFAFRKMILRVKVTVNTKDDDVIFSFRDDGGNAGLTVTVAAGLTGSFNSAAEDEAIAAASLCNFQVDASAPTAGSISFVVWIERI